MTLTRNKLRYEAVEQNESVDRQTVSITYLMYGGSTNVQSKIRSYCIAALSHEKSFDIPRFMSPSQEALCSL